MNNFTDKINEEFFRREIEKRVRTMPNSVTINCDLCQPLLFNDDSYEVLRRLGLPNANFCGLMNEELIKRVYIELVKRKLER